MVTHVIFDVDGLLLDTEKLYSKIIDILAKKHGKEFTLDIKRKQMGRTNAESAKVFIEELDVPITVEEYIDHLEVFEKEYFPDAELMPGAEKLIRHLSAHNIPMATASGSSEQSFNLKTLKHKELFSLMSHFVCGSDPELVKGKPAPDIYLLAMKRFEGTTAQPENVLVFEDADNGVRAALAANMKVVWVPDLTLTSPDIKHTGPVYQMKSLNDFKPEDFGLPKY